MLRPSEYWCRKQGGIWVRLPEVEKWSPPSGWILGCSRGTTWQRHWCGGAKPQKVFPVILGRLLWLDVMQEVKSKEAVKTLLCWNHHPHNNPEGWPEGQRSRRAPSNAQNSSVERKRRRRNSKEERCISEHGKWRIHATMNLGCLWDVKVWDPVDG